MPPDPARIDDDPSAAVDFDGAGDDPHDAPRFLLHEDLRAR